MMRESNKQRQKRVMAAFAWKGFIAYSAA